MKKVEIDELVATEIMGYTREFRADFGGVDGWRTGEDSWSSNFSPSTSITDAWQVIDKIQDEWAWAMDMCNLEKEVVVKIGRGYGCSTSVPLAICVAALSNIGIKVEVDED